MNRIPLAALASVFLIGCQSYDCNRLKALVQNDGNSKQLSDWADNAIFSRTFSKQDIAAFDGIAGPGAFAIRNGAIDAPPSVISSGGHGTLNVRLLGPDITRPDGVFLGERSFLGILISRNDMAELLKKARMSADAAEFTNGRISVICGRDER
jgi:hypothetical protein